MRSSVPPIESRLHMKVEARPRLNLTFLAKSSPTRKNALRSVDSKKPRMDREHGRIDSLGNPRQVDNFRRVASLLAPARRTHGCNYPLQSVTAMRKSAVSNGICACRTSRQCNTFPLPVLRLKNESAARERLLYLAQRQRIDTHMGAEPRSSPRTPSIAVLPFLNISTDAENDYFCDGLSEELINALTKIKGFFVVARGSAFSFRGKEIDVREIGRLLNVDTILEGSIQKVGDRLRVTAQLIDAGNGFHFWSERFERRMTDIFAIQDEITLSIVKQLKVELLAKERVAVLARRHESLESYNLYLKGRFYWAQRPQGIAKAIESFEQAIEKDSTFRVRVRALPTATPPWGHGRTEPCTRSRQWQGRKRRRPRHWNSTTVWLKRTRRWLTAPPTMTGTGKRPMRSSSALSN